MLRQKSVKSGPHNSHQRGEFQDPYNHYHNHCHYHDDDTLYQIQPETKPLKEVDIG